MALIVTIRTNTISDFLRGKSEFGGRSSWFSGVWTWSQESDFLQQKLYLQENVSVLLLKQQRIIGG